MADHVLTFSGFTLDLRSGMLHRDDKPAFLRPKAHALLTELAQNIGRIVSKSDLMDAVWPGIHVTEDSLTQSIREIRKVLGDDKQELIRTISKRGYMLAVSEPIADVGLQPIVAVLRFRNETGDAAQLPLVDGFAEDIINGLARFGTVTVLARNSSFSLSSESRSDWSTARSRIGADYLVEGSIRRSGKNLRVSISLIDAANLAQLWGERYDVSDDDIFSVQDDVIERIIGRLVSRLDDVTVQRALQKPVTTLAAYELSQQGLALMRSDVREDTLAAQRLFEQAIQRQPSYGAAYAQLAFTHIMLGAYGWSSPETLAEAYGLATKSIMLARDQPAGHRVMSLSQMYMGDFSGAENSLRKAMHVNPYDAETVQQMGYLLTLRGRPVEAMGYFERAVRLDPVHPPWYSHDMSLALYSMGRYDEVVTTIEASPTLPPWMRTTLAAAHAKRGDLQQAKFHAAQINAVDADFSPVFFAEKAVSFEHPSDIRHFCEGVFLALGLPMPT